MLPNILTSRVLIAVNCDSLFSCRTMSSWWTVRVTVCRNASGEKVFMAVTTEETEHITRMVSQQKRAKKSSKVIKLFYYN